MICKTGGSAGIYRPAIHIVIILLIIACCPELTIDITYIGVNQLRQAVIAELEQMISWRTAEPGKYFSSFDKSAETINITTKRTAKRLIATSAKRYSKKQDYFTNGLISRKRLMIEGIFSITKSTSSSVLYLLRLNLIEP